MNIKNKVCRIIGKGYKAAIAAVAFAFMMVNNIALVYASEPTTSAEAAEITKKVTGPIDTLTTILVTIFAAFGTIWLVKAVPELITAIQEQNNSGIFHAARSIGCALLLVALPVIIKLFV